MFYWHLINGLHFRSTFSLTTSLNGRKYYNPTAYCSDPVRFLLRACVPLPRILTWVIAILCRVRANKSSNETKKPRKYLLENIKNMTQLKKYYIRVLIYIYIYTVYTIYCIYIYLNYAVSFIMNYSSVNMLAYIKCEHVINFRRMISS